MSNTLEKELDEMFSLAEDESKKDNRDVHVIDLLGPYLDKRPKHGMGWFLYGDALRVIGRHSEALDAFHLLNKLEGILQRSADASLRRQPPRHHDPTRRAAQLRRQPHARPRLLPPETGPSLVRR